MHQLYSHHISDVYNKVIRVYDEHSEVMRGYNAYAQKTILRGNATFSDHIFL